MSQISKHEYKVPTEIERKILATVQLKKELEQLEAEIKDVLLEKMTEYDLISIKADRFTISLKSKTTYSLDSNTVPLDFSKVVLDTTKVGKYEKLYGSLPDGVKKSVTKFITWRTK